MQVIIHTSERVFYRIKRTRLSRKCFLVINKLNSRFYLRLKNLIDGRIISHESEIKKHFLCLEEYAVLYGEYESERRRNMDLTEARDRLADHIKVLSDELGDREVRFIYLINKNFHIQHFRSIKKNC